MSEQECRYPCGCEQFPEEHCACMDGHHQQIVQREAAMMDAGTLDWSQVVRIEGPVRFRAEAARADEADPVVEILAREFYEVVMQATTDQWLDWEHADQQAKAGYYDHAYEVREKLPDRFPTPCRLCGDTTCDGSVLCC